MADPTRFETQLQEVMVALGACKAPAIEAFWALWRRARGPSLRTLDDFRAACDALPDGPLALGHRVHRVLLAPEWQQMRKSCLTFRRSPDAFARNFPALGKIKVDAALPAR